MPKFRGTVFVNWPGEVDYRKYVRETYAENKEEFKKRVLDEQPPGIEAIFGPISRKGGED